MNLEQAITMTQLTRPGTANYPNQHTSRTRREVADAVFEIAARGGQPYENINVEDWAGKWLPSNSFILMELVPGQVAVPYSNRINSTKLQYAINASREQIDPIVVDLNVNEIGATNSGYTPKVIVVDGKHRHRAQVLQGHDKIMAWVGNLAAAELERRTVKKKITIEASGPIVNRLGTKLEAMTILGTAPVIRQDAGDGGSRPTGANSSGKLTARGGSLGGGSGQNPLMRAQTGARSSGQLSQPDPSDTKALTDPSDAKQSVDPSDRLQWKSDDPQFCAPGCDEDHEHNWASPDKESPGSGVGPGLGTNNGAHNSAQNKKIVAAIPGGSNLRIGNPGEGGGFSRPGGGGGLAPRSSPPVRTGGTFSRPGGGGGMAPRVRTIMEAGPIKVKKIVTSPKHKKMEARTFSGKQRKKLAKTGAAMPGGGFPIVNKQDLDNAKHAIGRAKNPAAARRHINERAKALGEPPIGQEMDAVSPPGFKYTVEKMKQDHPEISNPFALGWWEKNKGYTSHIHKPPSKK